MRQVTFILIIMTNICSGHKVISDWVTSKKTDHVELQYRWLQVNEKLKVREMRSIFEIEASHDVIIDYLKDCNKARQWSASVQTYQTFPRTDNSWFAYTLYSIPRPFRQKDLITLYQLEQIGDKTIITIAAKPEFIERVPKVKRLKDYTGRWVLHETINGATRVEFFSISYTKPLFPRFIQDPIIQKILANSFHKLKILTENEELKKITK